jgi:hypothetical protein
VPTHERLGRDDRENLQDRWKLAIQPDKEPAIIVCEPGAATQPTPQDDQLMSKHRVLSLKPHLRLEWRGQHGLDVRVPRGAESHSLQFLISEQIEFFDQASPICWANGGGARNEHHVARARKPVLR